MSDRFIHLRGGEGLGGALEGHAEEDAFFVWAVTFGIAIGFAVLELDEKWSGGLLNDLREAIPANGFVDDEVEIAFDGGVGADGSEFGNEKKSIEDCIEIDFGDAEFAIEFPGVFDIPAKLSEASDGDVLGTPFQAGTGLQEGELAFLGFPRLMAAAAEEYFFDNAAKRAKILGGNEAQGDLFGGEVGGFRTWKVDDRGFEEEDIAGRLRLIVKSGLEQARDEGTSKQVGPFEERRAGGEWGLLAPVGRECVDRFGHEAGGESFIEAGSHGYTSDAVEQNIFGTFEAGGDGDSDIFGDLIVSIDPSDFFDEVDIAGEVMSP